VKAVRSGLIRGRVWLAVAAGVLILVVLVPPAGVYARRFVFAETLQFLVFAAAAPALLVLGAPWKPLRRLVVRRGLSTGRGRGPGAVGPRRDLGSGRWRGVGRSAAGAWRGSGFGRGVAALLAFIAAAVAWRLPVTVDALATVPGLALVELVTLGGAGTVLWLELVESPPVLPHLSRPQRAAFAALAMWTLWILGYVLGFSQVAWYTAVSHPAGLSAVVDQEIATGLMWAVPAVCFAPVVFVAALTWLKDTEDPDEGLRAIVRAERRPGHGRWPRPPRGWDGHSA
jgi:cytochrome c oxidase assembly factor CtaG